MPSSGWATIDWLLRGRPNTNLRICRPAGGLAGWLKIASLQVHKSSAQDRGRETRLSGAPDEKSLGAGSSDLRP